MSSSENLFEKIDASLSQKKDSELALILLMIFVFIGFIVYSYIFPITDKKLKQTKRSLRSIEKKVQSEKMYLKSVTRNGDSRFYIKKEKNKIEGQKIQLEKTTYLNSYVDSKLKNLSSLLFNNKNWAKFLDSIALIAVKNHVKIKIIENKIEKPDMQKIKQVLNLRVEFNGRFKNVMKFINTIEESKLVVDIYDMNLKGANGVDGYINIGVWGMRY
jgi:hypothetical protein